MADPEGVEAPATRGRPTTGAPQASKSTNALGAAFAQQMTAKPPAALEEEWYVSIEGVQSGPFSLGEAQRWVGSKPFDADLHCWSEGFDDWLPVDKVSHFRGLRKRPERPTAPPPIPRGAPATSRSGRVPALAAAPPVAKIDESEPKPLFAATMAALERSEASAPHRANGSGTLTAMPNAGATAPAIPKQMPAIQAKASLPGPTRAGSGPIAKLSSGPGLAATRNALAEAFDVGPSESATNVEAPAYDDGFATSAPPAEVEPAKAAPITGDDDMEIGEVSRVVNLADLAKTAKPKPKSGRATGSVPKIPIGDLSAAAAATGRSTASNPAFGMTGPFQPIASESLVAAAPARERRRGMMILLLVAALLLAGGVVAVVMIMGNSNGDDSSTLAHSLQYDNSRPDDMPRPKNAIEAVTQGAQMAQHQQQQKQPQQHQQIHYTQPDVPETPGDPTKSKIKPEEIEDIANKNAEGTKRCYMRAQKGTLGIDVAEIKRIDVLFTLDPTGTVTTVSLSDHTNDQFGQCLIARVKAWKFRASPGGQFKFPLVFAN